MDFDSLVYDHPELDKFRVHRLGVVSPEIYELERRRVFDRCWLYLGHESEVPEPGDYARRVVAERPLFFARNRDGELNVFHNTCPHRGALVCRTDRGNAQVFQCFYHSWSFDTSGALIGVPDIDGYGPGFELAEMGLRSPRFDSYRGFVFVCFERETEPLRDYLAGALDYLDLVVDQDAGGMRVIPGSNRYSIKANWKLLAENSVDGYHLPALHRSFLNYVAGTAKAAGRTAKGDGNRRGLGRSLGNGHGVMENDALYGRPIALWHPSFGEEARAEIQSVKDELIARHGRNKALRMCEKSRNLLVFPNLIINDIMAVTIRVFQPTGPASMDVTAWELAPAGEAGTRLRRRLDSFLTFLGPGGFATPDDVEVLESCQQGFRSGGVEWSDVSRGLHREPRGNDELQMRCFWRRWQSLIADTPHVERYERGLPPGAVPEAIPSRPMTEPAE
ncbi:MAG: aromatic ring-hydroxylating dioxygenase subunit alpha [Acidobacteria bacterium]|nr:aromatic ring-hydroxylating dioxygenase subunit alpha [Acidobacteriota bacterium]